VRTLDLALEDAQLVAEDQELELEIDVRATAIDEGLEEQTEGRVEESQEHGEPSWQVVSDPAAVADRSVSAIS
jgi:predicted transcriptional regulator